jgi:hypothetical protein
MRRWSVRAATIAVTPVVLATMIGAGFRWLRPTDKAIDLTGIVITDASGIGTVVDVRIGAAGTGGLVRLMRAAAPSSVHRGHDLDLSLVFAVDEPLDSDWTVFVHVEREGYRLNADHPPAAGRHPTSAWRTGELIVDAFRKTVPLEAPPGRYEVWVGLYRGNDRLPVVAAGPVTDGVDRIRVGVVNLL